MIFSWFRRRRRRKLLAQPFPESWNVHLDSLPFYERLSADDQKSLRDATRVIVAEKSWEGCGGQEINEEVQVIIAAQAALLLLGVEHEYYRRLQSIVVYPSTFELPDRAADRRGLVKSESSPVLGLAFLRGPVVLAWDSARYGAENWQDGRNVVIHEFAHKLDMLDGYADGAPPLENKEQYEAWSTIMSREYERLLDKTEKGRRTVLDKYGATNPAEFFAVATEAFFEKPRQLRKRREELYELLKTYYKQDPATRQERD